MTASPAPAAPLVDFAAAYAGAGLPIFPVNPHSKRPLVSQHLATLDVGQLVEWWQRWPNALIGHRVLPTQIILDVDPRHGGLTTWNALRDAGYVDEPSRVHLSGRGDGGLHAWFERPELDGRPSAKPLHDWARDHGVGHPVADGKRWTSGIDVLHHDWRYSILPPSPHPSTGAPYRWHLGEEPGPMSDELAALVFVPVLTLIRPELELDNDDLPGGSVRIADIEHGDSVADWYSATASWHDILPPAGWACVEGDGDADGSLWRHPAATQEHSASIRHGCLFVYTPNTEFEETEDQAPHGYTRFAAYTLLVHAGDGKAAAAEARLLRTPWTPEPEQMHLPGMESSWVPLDLTPVVASGYVQPRPEVLMRSDLEGDGCLFYTSAINGIHGDSGIGKSWVAVQAIKSEIVNGRDAVLVDLEDTPSSIVARLRLLGVSDETILRRLIYIRPTEPPAVADIASLVTLIGERTVRLLVIDSLGEAFSLDGVNEDKDVEVAPWVRCNLRPLADAGAAVVVIDHATKAADNPLHPSGSKRKRAAITGASYLVTAVVPLVKGDGGCLDLTCAKDRHGNYRRGEVVTRLLMTSDPFAVRVRLDVPSPKATDEPSLAVIEAAVRAVETCRDLGPFTSQNALLGAMGDGYGTDVKRAGIDVAVSRGAIERVDGGNRAQRHTYLCDLP